MVISSPFCLQNPGCCLVIQSFTCDLHLLMLSIRNSVGEPSEPWICVTVVGHLLTFHPSPIILAQLTEQEVLPTQWGEKNPPFFIHHEPNNRPNHQPSYAYNVAFPSYKLDNKSPSNYSYKL
jgi:hypothetical protein